MSDELGLIKAMIEEMTGCKLINRNHPWDGVESFGFNTSDFVNISNQNIYISISNKIECINFDNINWLETLIDFCAA